jgi:bifunctional non-homologous end joining protein LigD
MAARAAKGRRADGMPAGKAEWIKPGLVARVRFLEGEEKLWHVTVKDVREE